MTIDQFLKKLGETPARWTVNTDGQIRCDGTCPIMHVAGRSGSLMTHTVRAASKLRLVGWRNVMVAADSDTYVRTFWNPRIRGAIYEATVKRSQPLQGTDPS